MAIAPTGAIYKALSFDNTSSRNYGVYITGEAVYNAPVRDVEMITIPGRNGSFALDNGRFENITVTYPAGIFADTEADFRQAISDFRNFLCSKRGYCRLTDEYNPNEYRMAIYKAGLEVDLSQLRAGEFNITFECKPQRWLTSGETKETIAQSGDTITNPTLFPSSPLVEIDGYGTVNIGSNTIKVNNEDLGSVKVFNGYSTTDKRPTYLGFDISTNLLNVGDKINLSGVTLSGTCVQISSSSCYSNPMIDSSANLDSASISLIAGNAMAYSYTMSPVLLEYGTSLTSSTFSATYSYDFDGLPPHGTYTMSGYYVYDGANHIDVYISGTITGNVGNNNAYVVSVPILYGESTISTLLTPVYVDLDIGEAYGYSNGELTSLNSSVEIPAVLPTLASGANTITFDNTITSLKLTPRWWKV